MSNLLPTDSWVDRMHSNTLSAVQGLKDHKPYKYVHSCAQSTYNKISVMEESSKAATYEDLKDNCSGLTEFESVLGYGEATGMCIQDDPCVTFWKSTYDGSPCYFVDHSRISYIWVHKQERFLANDPVNW